jgi:superfamily II DNA or RNA helicase
MTLQLDQQDPFLYDIEAIHQLTDERTVRDGLDDFKHQRVTNISRQDALLYAQVEDATTGDKRQVEISHDPEYNLTGRCDCDNTGPSLCRHGVAGLIRYAAEIADSDALTSASAGAIGERIKSAMSEVRVEHLGGAPGFGAWRAWTVTSDQHIQRHYRVHVRSITRRANHCSCPDFDVNQLGTCKHIEAVLLNLRKREDFAQIENQPPPLPYIYLDWEARQAPRIRLHRASHINRELADLLDGHFDPAGHFRHQIPDEFLRLCDLLEGVDGIDVGDDALRHARRLAEQASHQLQAADIRAQIHSSGSRIPGVRARLYGYQMAGVAFLAANGRALLADDMGLGKTLQAIAAAMWLRTHSGAERILIVCPASLKHQWAREIERFTDAPVQIIQGNAEAREVQYRRGPGFHVANYELILRDLSLINRVLLPDLLILDEAQRIKNWRTKIATAVKRIQSRYAFVLSGTPLENRLEDLYSLMQVVDAHVLGPLWKYRVDFHISDEKGKLLGYRNLSELRRRLGRVMLRRDRRLVRDQLPDRIDQRIDVELTERQWELHNAAMSAAGSIANLAARRPLTPTEQDRLMSALQSARMACNAAGLVDKQTQGSPKLTELTNLLDELCLQSGLKVVVFSQWELMTRMVEMQAASLGLGHVRLHGGIPTHKRGALLDRFREDDAKQVFITTDAGATGLNLQNASVLINLDVPWNPAILEQRNARIHRLGQKNTVQIILMVAAGAYEETVLGILQGKRDLFDNVVEQDAAEDVVGVSKKLIEVLVDNLAGKEHAPGERDEQTEPPSADEPGERQDAPAGVAVDSIRQRWDAQEAEAICRLIEQLQQRFAGRIDQILGVQGGLMLVLDRVDAADDAALQTLQPPLPLALIDLRTLDSLNRLGEGSPLAASESLYTPPQTSDVTGHPLLLQAGEKLRAARLLMAQSCTGPAGELLLGAALAVAARLAGEPDPPTLDRAGVWLYTEIAPRGLLAQEQIGSLARILALTRNGQQIPDNLLDELLTEVSALLELARTV